MRIVGGEFRGRRLAPPRGNDIRPTSDRIREALFDILCHGLHSPRGGMLPENLKVLDAFAGTGALGFEALSRGVSHVTFIEKDPAACRLIERNVHALGVEDRITLLRRNTVRPAAPPSDLEPAGLVFLDPPYRADLAALALKALRARRWIGSEAIVVVEMAADEALEPPRGFLVTDERRYGDTTLVFLKCEGPGVNLI